MATTLFCDGTHRGCVVDGGVFINYRGEDRHSYGVLLYGELALQFGEEQVFLDCESIPAVACRGHGTSGLP